MAYQNVGTPRFFVSILQWLKSLGKFSVSGAGDTIPIRLPLVDINPTSQSIFHKAGGGSYGIDFKYKTLVGNFSGIMPEKKNFYMLLGHTLKDVFFWGRADNTQDYVATTSLVNLGSGTKPSYNGFSIGIGNNADVVTSDTLEILVYDYEVDKDYKIGSILYGTYYDMPHSPDLNLTMSREYGGIKTIETKGGASLSNSFYRGSPAWGDAGAGELDSGTPSNKNLARSGRRVWDLSFSYIQDSDVFPEISNLIWLEHYNHETGSIYYADTSSGKRLLDDDSFYSQVIHKTNGGQLPFIFQPDKSNNNPDQFAICKLDMKSFKFEQVANSVYNVKLKIREVW